MKLLKNARWRSIITILCSHEDPEEKQDDPGKSRSQYMWTILEDKVAYEQLSGTENLKQAVKEV